MAPYRAAGGGDLIRLGYRLTVNLTSDFAGIDRPLRTAEETERLIAITKKLSEGATMVHSTRDHADINREVTAVMADFESDFFQPSLARRRALIAACAAGEISEAELPRDVLTTLLMGNDALELEEHQILRESMARHRLANGSRSNARPSRVLLRRPGQGAARRSVRQHRPAGMVWAMAGMTLLGLT